MAVRKTIDKSYGTYFLTITCYKWTRLFEITNGYDLVYKWFDYLKGKGNYINGYVIMPNHFHAMLSFQNSSHSINKIIGNGKRFLAYQIVDRLKQLNRFDILTLLGAGVNQNDRKRGKLHEVFESSFDWKECWSDNFIDQKLDYMHQNPKAGKWDLVEDLISYPYSSAKFYLTDIQGDYIVTSISELKDIDLTNTGDQ